MKTFNVNAIRTDEYEIEIDETIWNEQELKEWSKVFHDVDSVSDIVKHLSFLILRFGINNFYEGIGTVKILRKDGTKYNEFEPVRDNEYAKGIVVRILVEDEDYDFELNELPSAVGV